MKDPSKQNQKLIAQNALLRQRIRELEQSEAEHERTEEAPWKSKEQFSIMFEMASIGVTQSDPITRRFLLVNPKMCEITGYSAEEMLALSITEITHPEDRERDWEAFQNAISGKSPNSRLEKRYIRKDGAIIWVNLNMTVIRDSAGQSIHVMAAIEDITKRKQMEETLRQSEERYRTILDETAEGYFEVDLAGNYTFVNDADCRLLGYSREVLIGTNFRNQMPEESIEILYNAFNKIFISRQPERGLFCKIIRKDGTIGFAEITAFPLNNPKGEIIGFRGISRDITDRKRAEEERHHYEKLQGVLEMAGAICHEMNQPMQIISGYSEMLLMNIPENDPIHTKLDTINQQIHRMGDITKKLMKIEDFDTQDYAGFTRIININKSAGNDTE